MATMRIALQCLLHDQRKSVETLAHVVCPVANQTRAPLGNSVIGAVAEGYAPIPCVSGIDGGAMGVHYVNADYMKDEVPDLKRPQAVMYEPMPGSMIV